MNFSSFRNVYLLGIGGIGMSALARYFNASGKRVAGYDKTATPLTEELQAENIAIHFDESILAIRDMNLKAEDTLIIYTPAVPKEHSEYQFFINHGFTLKKRSEVLGIITENSFTIAVAGTHGKTTTSSLIAHMLRSSGVDCSAFLGGITQNYNTNLFIGKECGKAGAVTVVEADEYDRSFLALYPDIAVITSVDADHLDIYGNRDQMHESYNLFARQIKTGGVLIAKRGTEAVQKGVKARLISYALDKPAMIHTSSLNIADGSYHYSIVEADRELKGLTLGLPGSHNVENSVAATAVARLMGLPDDKIRNSLASFKGVKRRFEYQIRKDKLVYIDDYAHHPEELRACIQSVREMYPGKKLTGVFQPHLYTRTRDFAEGFMKSLSMLDEVILLDIYPAREKPIEGITSAMLLNGISSVSKMLCAKSELIDELKKRKPEVLLTLGAGDIDALVGPIKQAFENSVN
ncbi:MAG: UDP-N-acetylmuramate--L-alanine ligase [Bacteroidia bacterium]